MLRAALILLALIANLLLWGIPILLGGLVRRLVPPTEFRTKLILFLASLAERWVAANDWILDRFLATKWEVAGVDELGLRRDGHYLIIANHLSWVDIVALFRAFHGRTAFIRFFLKHELIWMPIVGQACWALEFPFMKRHSADYLARHPEKRGADLETTRRACRRYRRIPVAVLNFLEGTRFTREKHADQESPYRHLLRPRIGGIAFVLASMGDLLDATIDVTIAYDVAKRGNEISLWSFLTNRVRRVIVRARRLEVPTQFYDAAVTEPGPARDAFKEWVDGVWREKDALLDTLTTPS